MNIGLWRQSDNFNYDILNGYHNIKLFDLSELSDLQYEILDINIIISSSYSIDDFNFENRILEKGSKILIHVYIVFNNIVIAPIRRKKSDICCNCLYHALKNNRKSDLIERADMKKDEDVKLDIFSEELFKTIILDLVSNIKNDRRYLQDQMINISLSDMTVTQHNVKRDEFCTCLTNEEIEEYSYDYESEEICLNTRLRIKEEIEIEKIKKDIYDPVTGIIANIYKDMNSKFLPMICVEFNSSNGKIVNGAYGRVNTYDNSESSAVLEMLERYSNMWPKKKIKRIRVAYKDLKDNAINPRDLILNDINVTKFGNKSFKEYNDSLSIDWVYGYSIINKKEVLVPEQVVYFDIDEVRTDVNRFVFETSNGAALGGSIQEATLYGLFEIIERDSFLITWYNKLSLNRIDIDSIDDNELRSTIKYIQNSSYDIYLFDSTMENRIPSVICIAINRDSNSVVSSYLAAGCHINPIKAIESALVEVISSIPVYEKSFIGKEEEAKDLYKNPNSVLKMEDHVLLFSLKKTIKNYDFLLNSKVTKSIDELYPEWNKFKDEKSITKILNYVVSKVTKYNKDVIVINCLNDLIKGYGLYAVKVLVPGMLPMTFGQQNKRINIDRVKQVPVICKYREREVKSLNLYPHPFP